MIFLENIQFFESLIKRNSRDFIAQHIHPHTHTCFFLKRSYKYCRKKYILYRKILNGVTNLFSKAFDN